MYGVRWGKRRRQHQSLTYHAQIPVSKERQIAFINEQISEIIDGIKELKNEKGDDFSIKQMERQKKLLREKLQKMKDEKRKDDVVNFEELGIDRIFVDEAHYYKNRAKRCRTR